MITSKRWGSGCPDKCQACGELHWKLCYRCDDREFKALHPGCFRTDGLCYACETVVINTFIEEEKHRRGFHNVK